MTRTVVGIDGMACSMCESHVNDTVRRNFHVKSVKASHKKKQAEIISAEPLDEAALRKAIGDTGYMTGRSDRLHDCRARNVVEAIMWHCYDKRSDSYNAALNFYNATKEERDAVVAFINAI